ncbi:uncharacterized protein LOC117793202, partial [Drosophila innubila]|uniref:uncharacterized protein LOC117793202 n=1 Tax=Drosophila innubila TaxID=198719 RepID=UPI00148CE9E0
KKGLYAMAAPEIPAEVAVSHITYVMGLHLPGQPAASASSAAPVSSSSSSTSSSSSNHHHSHAHPHIQHSRHASVIIETAGSPLCGKDAHYEHQLTPQDGSVRSVRSDEGYHSNECQEDGLTPPEDSSDSESEHNYVLDCSKKAIAPKETVIAQTQKPSSVTPPAPTTPMATTPSSEADKNEYRKFKVKMPLKYEFKHKACIKQDVEEPLPAATVAQQLPELPDLPEEATTTTTLGEEHVAPTHAHVECTNTQPASSTVIVLEPTRTIVPLSKPYYESDPSPLPGERYVRFNQPSSSILETILTSQHRLEAACRQVNAATPPPTSPTEMAYSYKKSQRYGNAVSPDSSSNLGQAPEINAQLAAGAEEMALGLGLAGRAALIKGECSPPPAAVHHHHVIYSPGQHSPNYAGYAAYGGATSTFHSPPHSSHSPFDRQSQGSVSVSGSVSGSGSSSNLHLLQSSTQMLNHPLMQPLTPLQRLSPLRISPPSSLSPDGNSCPRSGSPLSPNSLASRGYRSLPYPLKKKDGKMHYECN